ncbi:MAG: hypothetical protein HN601_06650 [Candidatus Marinimicrobia bacterium]|jgi:hypothetical protein|nr:hypothetical protein [Candidatus Neomarinimicrobiota bacterium]
MEITALNILKDKRMNCLSVLAETESNSYLLFVEEIFANQGGIDGQRAPLKSKTAIQIRNRMVEDISEGTVLPPIVIGLLVDKEQFDEIEKDQNSLTEIIKKIDKDNLSIIDGMQRTTSIKTAIEKNHDLKTPLRIDFWIAQDIKHLIYRMLILNTAQIPWSIKRQLEVVFNPFKKRIETEIDGITLYSEDGNSRRSHAGEYQASSLIELFLNFSVKKVNIDLKETLTEEFARLDIISSTAHPTFLDDFIISFSYLYKLDTVFSVLNTNNTELELKKFKKGIDLFSSHPARTGFITAISHFIYGKPGFNYNDKEIVENKELLISLLDKEIAKISVYDEEQLFSYLDFSTLDERISRRSGKIGEFEREFFLKSFAEFFSLLKSGFELKDLQPIWLSYN